jgi:phosphatidylglycerophosphate synthase
MMSENDARRPLKIRGVKIVKSIAQSLSRRDITPNQISVASVFFAAFSALSFLLFSYQNAWWLLILAALFIQLRLLCNLFDGMVAVEGGKSSPSGELFNDIPDRITDPMILIAAGYAINMVSWGAEIGWCAGLFAVLTAYVRTLSASIGAPVDFKGPMAKQHRMAVLTVACVLTVIEIFIWGSHYLLLLALIIIAVGSVVTCIRRALAAYYYLEAQ